MVSSVVQIFGFIAVAKAQYTGPVRIQSNDLSLTHFEHGCITAEVGRGAVFPSVAKCDADDDGQLWEFSDNKLKWTQNPGECLMAGMSSGIYVSACNAEDAAMDYDEDSGAISWSNSHFPTPQCLTVVDGLNPLLRHYDCVSDSNPSERQSWSIHQWGPVPVPSSTPAPSAGIQIQSAASSLCVDLPGGDTSNGALLWMWDCYGGANQQWSFQDGQLVYLSDPSKCVDLLGGDSTNGNRLGLWDCYQGNSQLWGFDSERGTIYLSSSTTSDATKCAQISGESQGDPLVIWDCTDEPHQVWTVDPQQSSLAAV